MSLFSTFAFPATGASTSRTMSDRLSDIINVKDYGARGDGLNNDGAAIQAAFDAAYGPAASPNAGNSKANKGVYIPRGTYLIDQQLFLNEVQGAWVFGDGQKATRLLYTGSNSLLPSGDITSLLTARTVTYSRIEGITFDATGGNATVCVQLMNFAAISNDGTGNSWFDCGFVGGTDDGFLCTLDGSGQLGSEELFVGCTFDSCNRGVLINNGNALNYSFIGCNFKNCIRGIWCVVGSVNLIQGCTFNNPSYASFTGSISGTTLTVSGVSGTIVAGQYLSGPTWASVLPDTFIVSGSGSTWTVSRSQTVSSISMFATALDIFIKQAQCPAIIGCRSISPNFCLAGPVWIAGCYHNPAVAGGIWSASFASQDLPKAVIEGCLGGANSGIYGSAADGDVVYLRGNNFTNAGYLSTFSGTVAENI